MKIKALIPLFIASLFGCGTNKTKNELIELASIKPTEGFIDIILNVTEINEGTDYYEYNAQGLFKGDTVGLIVKLKKDIPAGFVNGEPKNMFLNNAIEFVSKGNESNLLLNALSLKYELNNQNLTLKESQVFTAANLNEHQPDYRKSISRFKIFLENDNEYAELFVNFDFGNKLIALNEKDPEYRKELILLLKK